MDVSENGRWAGARVRTGARCPSSCHVVRPARDDGVVRRVVTGHSADGRAIVASDGEVEPILLDAAGEGCYHRVWAFDAPPSLPDRGEPSPAPMHYPPVGGVRFGAFTVPPAGAGSIALDAADLEAALPGLLDHMDADDPGMHTSASVDYLVVGAGRIVLELDDGVEVELGPGDAVVQNGTRHRWRNPFSEPCSLVITSVGASHAAVARRSRARGG